MNDFLGLDGPLMTFLNRVADIFILNLLFLICSIPIVTIGASSTALYSVTLKMVKGEESYIVKSFLKAFKANFLQSTGLWMMVLLLGILLWADFKIIGYLPESVSKIMQVLLTAIGFVYLMVVLFLFPYVARFYNKTLTCMKNALFISILNFPYTLLILLLTVGIVFITFFNTTTMGYGLMIWLLGGFALYAYVTSYMFRHIFAKYETGKEAQA